MFPRIPEKANDLIIASGIYVKQGLSSSNEDDRFDSRWFRRCGEDGQTPAYMLKMKKTTNQKPRLRTDTTCYHIAPLRNQQQCLSERIQITHCQYQLLWLPSQSPFHKTKLPLSATPPLTTYIAHGPRPIDHQSKCITGKSCWINGTDKVRRAGIYRIKARRKARRRLGIVLAKAPPTSCLPSEPQTSAPSVLYPAPAPCPWTGWHC